MGFFLLFLFNIIFSGPSQLPEMVGIKGGDFLMGQIDGEGDEHPVHRVRLDDFYIGKYEVTVAEYRAFCMSVSKDMPEPPEWGWIDEHPILNISWSDAKQFVGWLNQASGEKYRLPTEAEFEYVLRAGGKPGIYPLTDQGPNENVADQQLLKTGWKRGYWTGYDDGFAYTSPVGSFPANELGVHDINGNVWEWVSDWYADYEAKDVLNPMGPENGTHKVGRGASFNADPWHCRSAGRNWMEADVPISAGFRLAKDE